MSEPRSHQNRAGWKLVGSVVVFLGSVATIIGLWPSIAGYFIQLNDQQSESPVAVSTMATQGTPDPAKSATTPDPTNSVPVQVTAPVQIAAPVMKEIVVGTVVATKAVPCCMVGPGLFQLQEDDRTELGYTWSSRMSDGTENDSENCAMLVTITGPESPPALRKNDCTVIGSNGFSNYGNIARVSTTGTYTITVVDEVSGVTGVGKFTVLP